MRKATTERIMRVLEKHEKEFISISQIARESKVGYYVIVLFVAKHRKDLAKMKLSGRTYYYLRNRA